MLDSGDRRTLGGLEPAERGLDPFPQAQVSESNQLGTRPALGRHAEQDATASQGFFVKDAAVVRLEGEHTIALNKLTKDRCPKGETERCGVSMTIPFGAADLRGTTSFLRLKGAAYGGDNSAVKGPLGSLRTLMLL